MATQATVPSDPFTPRSRERAQQELVLAWSSIRAASAYIQQLDSLIVRHDVWGNAYANAQAVLDASLGRVEAWEGSPYPAEDHFLSTVRVEVHRLFRAAQRHLVAFEWGPAHASLFEAGLDLLTAADVMGVEL